jgi:hypothetical protein
MRINIFNIRKTLRRIITTFDTMPYKVIFRINLEPERFWIGLTDN